LGEERRRSEKTEMEGEEKPRSGRGRRSILPPERWISKRNIRGGEKKLSAGKNACVKRTIRGGKGLHETIDASFEKRSDEKDRLKKRESSAQQSLNGKRDQVAELKIN